MEPCGARAGWVLARHLAIASGLQLFGGRAPPSTLRTLTRGEHARVAQHLQLCHDCEPPRLGEEAKRALSSSKANFLTTITPLRIYILHIHSRVSCGEVAHHRRLTSQTRLGTRPRAAGRNER